MLGLWKGLLHHFRLSSKDSSNESSSKCGYIPYDDRLALVVQILETLGVDHEVSSTGTSIGTSRFGPKMKTLTLIMYLNLYPLTNTGFTSLGRA